MTQNVSIIVPRFVQEKSKICPRIIFEEFEVSVFVKKLVKNCHRLCPKLSQIVSKLVTGCVQITCQRVSPKLSKFITEVFYEVSKNLTKWIEDCHKFCTKLTKGCLTKGSHKICPKLTPNESSIVQALPFLESYHVVWIRPGEPWFNPFLTLGSHWCVGILRLLSSRHVRAQPSQETILSTLGRLVTDSLLCLYLRLPGFVWLPTSSQLLRLSAPTVWSHCFLNKLLCLLSDRDVIGTLILNSALGGRWFSIELLPSCLLFRFPARFMNGRTCSSTHLFSSSLFSIIQGPSGGPGSVRGSPRWPQPHIAAGSSFGRAIREYLSLVCFSRFNTLRFFYSLFLLIIVFEKCWMTSPQFLSVTSMGWKWLMALQSWAGLEKFLLLFFLILHSQLYFVLVFLSFSF